MWSAGPVSDREHFEAVARDAWEPLRRYLRRRTDPATADDVLSDTLLVAWRRRAELPDPALPWLFGIARNALANAHRAGRRQRRVAGKVATLDPPVEVTEPAGDDIALHAALAELSETDREVIRLWAWEQLAPAEIGIVLDITPNAASIRLHRAREKLRAELRKIQDRAGHEPDEGRQP